MLKKIISHPFYHKYPTAKQFTKFCLVGLTNFVVDISVYWLLTRIFYLYYIVAGFGAFLVAVTWSFFINRRWTFRYQGKDIYIQYVKFFVVNILGMIINLTLLYVMVDIFYWYDLWSKFIGSVIVSIITFSLSRLWAFKALKPIEFKKNVR